ncbi:hypothetical protein ON010_g6636 [Phytophthora cinnamomi]|nr:hypothetical protein ON010_g6636 [Phytophthora cinnamomi]
MAPRKAKRKLDDDFSNTPKHNIQSASTPQSLRPRKSPENESEEIDELANNDNEDSSGEFEVEGILREEGGLFFVKWAGYDSEDTWEPEDHLKPDMVVRFRQSSKRRAKSTHQEHVDNDTELEAAIEPPATGIASYGAGTVSEGADRAGTISNLIGAHLDFATLNEMWMPEADYRKVGSAYLTYIIARIKTPNGKNETVPRGTEGEDIWDEFEQVDEAYARYDCQESIREDVGEVERVAAMSCDPLGMVKKPENLFAHDDGTTAPRVH